MSFSVNIETNDEEFCSDNNSLVPFTISSKSLRVHNRYCRGKYCLSPLTFPTYTLSWRPGFVCVMSLLPRNSNIHSFFSLSSFLGRPRLSCSLIRIWYFDAKFWIISTFLLGLCGKWSSRFLQTSIRDCLVEKAVFGVVGVVLGLCIASTSRGVVGRFGTDDVSLACLFRIFSLSRYFP